MNEKNIVQKSRALNELRSNDFDYYNYRIFCVAVSKLNPYAEKEKRTDKVRFSLKEYQEVVGLKEAKPKRVAEYIKNLDTKTGEEIKKQAKSITQIGVVIPNKKEGFVSLNVIRKFELLKEDGVYYVELTFEEELLDEIYGISKNFISYRLYNILNLKSYQQQRLYEFVKQHQHQQTKVIKIDDLKMMLGIKKEAYKHWGDFSEKILKTSQKEFKKSTDIEFTFKPIRNGRKTESIEFEIFENEANKDKFKNIKTNIPEEPYVDDEENIVDVPAEPIKIKMYDDKGNEYWVLESDLLRVPTEEEVNHPDSYRYLDDEDDEIDVSAPVPEPEEKTKFDETDKRLLEWLPEECKSKLAEIREELIDCFACGNIPALNNYERDAILIKMLKRVNATYRTQKEAGAITKNNSGYYLGILKNKIEKGEFDKFIIMPEEPHSETSYDINNVGRNTILENLNKKSK